jgi:Protein of unknown function (DUF2867)
VDAAGTRTVVSWGMATATLPRADYSDTFATPSDGPHTAEAWARAAFEPASLTDSKQLVWRRVLQLRLGPLEDANHVAGWAIVTNRDDRLVLAAESWHLTGRLVFDSGPDDARVTTRVTFKNGAGRLLWAGVGPVHRRAVPDILAAARRRLSG